MMRTDLDFSEFTASLYGIRYEMLSGIWATESDHIEVHLGWLAICYVAWLGLWTPLMDLGGAELHKFPWLTDMYLSMTLGLDLLWRLVLVFS